MNIYVGNLSPRTTEADLQKAFSLYGRVTSVVIIKDRATGASRGFGFVEMPNREEALKAISALNSKELNGREMKVSEARPRKERRGRPRY